MAFVPYYTEINTPGMQPVGWIFVLHGIFGKGANWRSFARKFVAQQPQIGMILVDLRMHGRSQGAPDPQTLHAAASDLVVLAAQLEDEGKRIIGICGHSFGGKVALRYRGVSPRSPVQTWVLDCSPTAQVYALDDPGNQVVSVLKALEQMPRQFAERDEFITQMTDKGFALPIAHWLAMNIDHVDGQYRFGLDLIALRSLLTDYHKQDLWDQTLDPAGGPVHFVRAGRSEILRDEDWDRLGRASKHVHLHTIEQAGHWLHVDALPTLVSMIATQDGWAV